MEFVFFVYVCIIWAVALKTISGLTATRKLCVEYRVSNSRRGPTFLGIVHHTHESGCLRQCGRLSECSADNYLNNDTCQLLSPSGDCNAPDELEGSSYIHLADCRGDIPRHADSLSRTADTQCLIWHRPLDDSVICPQSILKSPDNTTCAAVGARKGLYLPCWYKDGTFRMVSEEVESLKCNNFGAGLLVQVKPGCAAKWQPYNVENSVPEKVVKISVWKYGSPLYMVAAKFSRWRIGYYSPSAKRSFILHQIPRHPGKVRILIIKWLFFIIRSYPNFYDLWMMLFRQSFTQFYSTEHAQIHSGYPLYHGPLVRYVKLRVAHATSYNLLGIITGEFKALD